MESVPPPPSKAHIPALGQSLHVESQPSLPLKGGALSVLLTWCPSPSVCPAPRYRVVVRASNGMSSVASQPHRIWVQRRIVPNRLTATASALVNATVTFGCRINFGTDVAYLWDFGDGTMGLGDSSASHVYSR